MRARVESNHQPEPRATDVHGTEPRLSGDHVDRLLTDTATDISTSDDEATPMNGVWLATAAGVLLWALIAAVVLLLT